MYEKFLELQTLGEHQRLQAETAKYVTNHIRAVKLAPPEKLASKERLHNPILDHALSEAKTMTKLHGATSKEAKLAWEAVEQISSNDSSEVMKVSIDAVDGECLVEMIEACEAMEELNRALFLNENKEVGRYQG
jgi:pantoate kinase